MAAVVIDLGYKPRQWQRECHLTKARFRVLALHRRAGKTELALAELIDRALRFDKDLGLFLYVAPYLKQAKAIAWARLKQKIGPLIQRGVAEVNESELWVRIAHNGAMIRIFGGDNPDAARGLRVDGVVIDEVANIKPDVWQDIIQPALSDRKGWALFIGTPNGVNLFSELFYQAKVKPDWHSAAYTVYDTEAIDPDEVERLRKDMPEASFAREYLVDFTAAGDDQLISLSDVHAASRRHLRADQYNFAARVLGVDPARFGDDRSVIMPRQGLYCGAPKVFQGIDNMTLAGHVADYIEQWQPDAVFVDVGNGSGVIDRLRQLGHDIVEVNFGSKPNSQRYVNKRTEMWWLMREWLDSGGVIPNDPRLKQDLAAPRYWFDPSDRIVLEPKDDIKARGLPSPDLADALAVTFAFPAQPRQRERLLAKGARGAVMDEVLSYNPLDHIR